MIINKLKDLEKESIQRGIPILGSEKGSWLYKKVLEVKPKKILELGTANGYSGCILGSQGAKLITVEIDAKIEEEAKNNFEKFGIDAKIVVEDGVSEADKMASQKNFLGYFDLIFIDFAKKKYIQVLENCIKLVRKGGLIIADNTSWASEEYRKAVLNHPKLKTEIIDIADEMACSEKISD